jgi:hypothetical protein
MSKLTSCSLPAAGKTGKAAVAALRQRGLRARLGTQSTTAPSDSQHWAPSSRATPDFDSVSAAVAGVSSAYFCYPIAPRLLDATEMAQAASEAGARAVLNSPNRHVVRLRATQRVTTGSPSVCWIALR